MRTIGFVGGLRKFFLTCLVLVVVLIFHHLATPSSGVVTVDGGLAGPGTSLRRAPEFQQDPECRRFLESPTFLKTFNSQYGQDAHVFYNYFAQRGPEYRGFYVDLAAAYPKRISNTFFFDKCLGWSGLCIEGSPVRAESLRRERSCVVEELAITDDDNAKVSVHEDDPNTNNPQP